MIDEVKKMKKRICVSAYIILMLMLIVWLVTANNAVERIEGKTVANKVAFEKYNTQDTVYWCFDEISTINSFTETASFQGWAFVETVYDNPDRFVSILLKNSDICYELKETTCQPREIQSAFSDKSIPSSHVGILEDFSLLSVSDGIYDLYIYCWENEHNYGLVDTKLQLVKANGSITKRAWQSEAVNTKLALVKEKGCTRNVETLEVRSNLLCVSGWAFVHEIDTDMQQVYLLFEESSGSKRLYPTKLSTRPDVASVFGSERYSQSGYEANMMLTDFDDGAWTMTVLVQKDGKTYESEPISFVKNGNEIVCE